METSSSRPVSLKLDAADHERLKTLADARQRRPHFLMREAIRQYLDREEARESFRQEALASWRDYRQNGQHLSAAEVAGWLETWGSPQEGEIPPCHD